MNWVGGARNRLKVPNERKLQMEYFERKRLASKLNRGQVLDGLKAPISKDLLFLSKAASNAKIDDPHTSPIRQAPKRVNLDSCAKHPLRDIELPMSPIEKPSTLDLVDTNTVASNLSFDQSFYRQPLDTGNLPRVSTMKVPRKRLHESSYKEPGMSMLDVSCMTESLFPVTKATVKREPLKFDSLTTDFKREPLKSNHLKDDSSRQSHNKYSLDDLLNASQVKESYFPKPQKKEIPSKVVPKHADQMLWSKIGGVFGNGNRKRQSAIGIDDACVQPKQQKLAKKEDTRYNFGDWMAKVKKPKGIGKRKPMVEDATLEIQYAPKEVKPKVEVESFFRNHPPAMLQPPCNQNAKSHRSEYPSEPWTNEYSQPWTNESSLLMTENPLATYHLPSEKADVKVDKPVKEEKAKYLKRVDLDSCAKHPLKDIERSIEKPSTLDQVDTSTVASNLSFDQSFYGQSLDSVSCIHDESILGPIKRMNEPSKPKHSKRKRSTAFEQMMSSFEDSSACSDPKGVDVEDVMVGLDVVKPEHKRKSGFYLAKDTHKKVVKQHSRWKDFVSGDSSKSVVEPAKPKTYCAAIPTKFPLLKAKKTMNCSAFEEVLHLEQEDLMGLDACTQELTMSPYDCAEEPIMQRVPDMTNKITECPFDSSLDSSLTTKSQSKAEHELKALSQDGAPGSSVCSEIPSDQLSCCLLDQTECPGETEMKVDDPVIGEEIVENATPEDSETEKTVVSGEIPIQNTVEIYDSTPLTSRVVQEGSSNEDPTLDFADQKQLLPSTDDSSMIYCDKIIQCSPQWTGQMAEQDHRPSLVSSSTQTSLYDHKDQQQQTTPTTSPVCKPGPSNTKSENTEPLDYSPSHSIQSIETPIEASATPELILTPAPDHVEAQPDPSNTKSANTEPKMSCYSPNLNHSIRTIEANATPEPIQPPAPDNAKTGLLPSLVNVSTQACSKEIAALQEEAERLREELMTAESTIIWQSLMMRLQNIEHL